MDEPGPEPVIFMGLLSCRGEGEGGANYPARAGCGGPHMFEDVQAGSLDMARHEIGGLVGLAGLDEPDKLAVIGIHLRAAWRA